MTASPVNAHWSEIKGDIKKSWSKLSDGDLEKTKGDIKEITVLLQKNYSEGQDANSKKLTEIFKKFDDKKAQPQMADSSKNKNKK